MRILITGILVILLGLQASGQATTIFRPLWKAELPSAYVFQADEDENGFLWIGTDKGLSRYDGFHWKTFTTDEGMPGNYFSKIRADKHGGIWCQISSHGIFHFNIKSLTIQPCFKNLQSGHMELDSQGNLLISSYSKQGVDIIRFSWANPSAPDTLVRFLCDFSQIKVSINGPGNEIFVIRKFPYSTYLINNKKKDVIIRSLSMEGETGGVYMKYFDPSTFVADRKIYRRIEDSLIALPFALRETNRYLHAISHNNQIWIWNEEDGIYILDGKNLKHLNESNGLPTRLINMLYRTAGGRLLICTLGAGILEVLPAGLSRMHFQKEDILALTQDAKRALVLTTDQLYMLSVPDGKTLARYPLSTTQAQQLQIINDQLYVSTMQNVKVYKQAPTSLRLIDSFFVGAGSSGVMVRSDSLLAGTYGSGLVNLIHGVSSYPAIDTGMMVVEKLKTTGNGYALLSEENGLLISSKNGSRVRLKVDDGLPSNQVMDLEEWKDSLFVLTKKGIAVIKDNRLVRTQGLTFNPTEEAIAVFHDARSALWMATNRALYLLNGQQQALFLAEPGNPVLRASYNSHTDQLLMATGSELLFLTPGQLVKQRKAIAPKLAQVILEDEAIEGNYVRLSNRYQKISFQLQPFATLDLPDAQLWYRLKGFGDEFVLLKDSLTISYPTLPAGRYELEAYVQLPSGSQTQTVSIASFEVAKPFYQNPWLQAIAFLIFFGVIYLFQKRRLELRNKRQQELHRLEGQLQEERHRISKDLHDHLGSSLVTMIAQTDQIESRIRNQDNELAASKLEQLSQQGRHTMNVLRETIWAVQEIDHSLDEFISRVSNFLQRSLNDTGIEWTIDRKAPYPARLSALQSLNLFRVIQETTQNIIKHAHASALKVEFITAEQELSIMMQDNGRGFDTESLQSGMGLANMRERIAALQGSFEISSILHQGTRIILSVPLNQQS